MKKKHQPHNDQRAINARYFLFDIVCVRVRGLLQHFIIIVRVMMYPATWDSESFRAKSIINCYSSSFSKPGRAKKGTNISRRRPYSDSETTKPMT